MDIGTVKKELIDHIGSTDKTKLDMFELKAFAETVKIADDLAKPDPMDKCVEMFRAMNIPSSLYLNGFGNSCCCDARLHTQGV